MTPVFSNNSVSATTYKFWISSAAKYTSKSKDKDINNNDSKPTQSK